MKTRVVHFKKEPYDVFIARPSKWGCPFTYKENTRADFKLSSRKEIFDVYRDWLTKGEGQYLLKDLHELKGKTLGCWCKNFGGGGKRCHGDILLELIEIYCNDIKSII